MNLRRVLLLPIFLGCAPLLAQDFLDQLDQRLTFSAFDDKVRARVSGTLDLEFYHFNLPAPGLIESSTENLFNPRLTLFLDSQIGPAIYFFSQVRIDRHFDPSDEGAQIRLDEYALRVTPWSDGRFSLQVGKFATVVGNWIGRHLSWDNPFINAPLPYENVTPLSDFAAPYTYGDYDGQRRGPKYVYLPVIWGPSYASGISVAGRLGKFEYAAEVKNAALSSRPESWDLTQISFDHPTVSGRLGFRPNQMWNFGFSASDGPYLRPEAEPTLPYGRSIDDFHQTVLGQDITFAWHHLQIWAEFYEARFDAPRLGNADTFAYYLEAKYKFTPQLFGAVRWGQQFFSDVPNRYGGAIPWSNDVSRIEGAAGYRFTPHTQLKLEYYFQREDDPGGTCNQTLAAQLTVRF
jgi:hypothetical protein